MTDKTDSLVGKAAGELFDAAKGVPGLTAFAAFWFLLIIYCFGRSQLFGETSAGGRVGLSLIAFLFALPTYFLGSIWDRFVFDPLYTVNEARGFDGRWLKRNQQPFFGLLPAGDDLNRQRKNATQSLQMTTGDGVYLEATRLIENLEQWKGIRHLLVLSKLSRSLILPLLLLGVGMVAQTVYLYINKGSLDLLALVGGVVALTLGLALFLPYLDLRVKHLIKVYQTAAAVAPASQRSRGATR